MLEKTLSTFQANNLVLQQQYRERDFKTYSELLSCLILAEENNQLLLNNHQTRPTGSTPLPDQSNDMLEANATFSRRGLPEVVVVMVVVMNLDEILLG
ncbi:unnamed protein product [Rhodiola kirilowii]